MIGQTFECTSILEPNLDHSLQVAGFFSLSVTGKLQFISPSPIHHWQIISSLSLWSITNYNSLFVFLSLSFLPPTHNILCLFSLCLSDSLSHSRSTDSLSLSPLMCLVQQRASNWMIVCYVTTMGRGAKRGSASSTSYVRSKKCVLRFSKKCFERNAASHDRRPPTLSLAYSVTRFGEISSLKHNFKRFWSFLE